MLRRPIAAALLPLLLCTGPAGQAAEGRGATVVLRLPPSMSPAEVKGLIADLAAKGAQPSTAEPAPPAPAASPPLTTAIFAAGLGGYRSSPAGNPGVASGSAGLEPRSRG